VPETELAKTVSGATPRERAMRYSDAALGRFLDAALAHPWAKRTLFFVMGDHGFHENPEAEIDPDRHRVPLLMLNGGSGWAQPYRSYATTVYGAWGRPQSQLDVLPIVLHLVAPDGTRHASWGTVPSWWNPLADDELGSVAVLGPHGGSACVAALSERGTYVVEPLGRGRAECFRLDVPEWEQFVPVAAENRAGHTPAEDVPAIPTASQPHIPTFRLSPADALADSERAALACHARAFLAAAHRVLLSRTAAGE
jgi:hypothetical protein